MKKLKSIFDYSVKNQSGYRLPTDFLPQVTLEDIEQLGVLNIRRPGLPEVTEEDIANHYGTEKSAAGLSIGEELANLPEFTGMHAYQNDADMQGTLQILFELERYLAELLGFKYFSFQPCLSHHDISLALLIVKAYHHTRGRTDKKVILVPDSASTDHEEAIASFGFEIRRVAMKKGLLDVLAFRTAITEDVAGAALPTPYLVRLRASEVKQLRDWLRDHDGLMIWNGDQAHSILGYLKPGETGFDIGCLNLEKTFNAGEMTVVGVAETLKPYLPSPHIEFANGTYKTVSGSPLSAAKLPVISGNVSPLIRTYATIRLLGLRGLREIAESTLISSAASPLS